MSGFKPEWRRRWRFRLACTKGMRLEERLARERDAMEEKAARPVNGRRLPWSVRGKGCDDGNVDNVPVLFGWKSQQ